MASTPFKSHPRVFSLTASIAISRLERNYLSPVTLRRSDSYSDLNATSQKSPEIIIHAPELEPDHQACVKYLPNELIVGLPNPVNSKSISLLNAVLQLFIALPLINEQLPANSKIQILQNFITLVRSLHCNYGPLTSKRNFIPSVNMSASIYASDTNVGSTFRKSMTGLYKAPKECVNLDWLLEISNLSKLQPTECPPDISKIFSVFLENILVETRFGKNFSIELIETSLKKADSGIDIRSLNSSEHTDYLNSMPSRFPDGCEKVDSLTIQMGDYSENDLVTVVELINNKLGYSNFSSDNPRSALYSSASQTTSLTKQLKFTKLPTFLVLHFDRPYKSTTGFHKTTIEVPEELDLGYYLTQGVNSDINLKENNSSTGGEVVKTLFGNNNQETFYRLHGFVTQTNGHFLTYTRLRNGNRWFKCDDDNIIDFDLSTRVSSKGVMLAMYRLQS
ncbi:hypothetical protein HK096_008245 [Nowakowskiella sp. JEL0078]|nr:hypothetical protein HK096_008245 [Nowakowskiella sp. JEL0078]